MDSVNQKYYDKFSGVENEYDEYFELLNSVEIMSDNKLFEHYRKKLEKIESVALLFKEYKQIVEEINLAIELANDETDDIQKQNYLTISQNLKTKADAVFEKAKADYSSKAKQKFEKAKVEISFKLGDNLIVQDLKNLVENFASANDLEIEVISETKSQISLFVAGDNAFENLKALNGKICKIKDGNESSALVVVLQNGETEIEINEEDIKIEISKSSGAGGQHINKTESAVKLIHIPTGITAECQDERSQGKNKAKAMTALKEKILQKTKENNEKYIKNQRNSLKTAIFSNTPVLIIDCDKNKVTDNRTKKTYKLKEILEGNIEIISRDLKV